MIMSLNIDYVVGTVVYVPIITGIIIGVVRQRRAIKKNVALSTVLVWLGLSLFHTIIKSIFKHFDWEITIVNFIFTLLTYIFIGYIVGRVGYFLFHAYRKK